MHFDEPLLGQVVEDAREVLGREVEARGDDRLAGMQDDLLAVLLRLSPS